MNIIFGQDITDIEQRYVVLELDTFVDAQSHRQTAYCIVDSIPELDWPVIDTYRQAHHDLMKAYRQQDWDYCEHALEGLCGHWNGELDSFYHDLRDRIQRYRHNPPAKDWDGSRSVQDLA